MPVVTHMHTCVCLIVFIKIETFYIYAFEPWTLLLSVEESILS